MTLSTQNVVLVTGGAGFIGSNLALHLLESTDANVVNVDKLTYAGVIESLADAETNPRYHFEQIDIADVHAVRRVCQRYRPKRVFHLAAESHVDRSIASVDEFVQTNVVGTATLLQECLRLWQAMSPADRSDFRFIHISTDEVFGELPHPDSPDLSDAQKRSVWAQKFNELTPYAPNSPYSASKAASDHFVRAWGATYQMPVLTGHCSNNYGPRQLPEKLIPRMILNARAGLTLPIYGAGNQIRDWLYVQDHIGAICCIAERGEPGQTYTIGGNNQKRNIEVVEEICDLLEDLAPLKPAAFQRYRDLIRFTEDRLGHDKRYAIDHGKLTRDLGWRPRMDFANGLRRTVEWYLNNPDWTKAAMARMSGSDDNG